MVKHLTAIGKNLAIAATISAAGLLLVPSVAEAWSPYGTYGSKGGWNHRRLCLPYKECPPGCPPGRWARCTVHSGDCSYTYKLVRCP
jgi:hypothetical protein